MDLIPSSFGLQLFLALSIGFIGVVVSLLTKSSLRIKIVLVTSILVLSALLFFVSFKVNKQQEQRVTSQEKKLNELTSEFQSYRANQNLNPQEIIAKLKAAHQQIFAMSEEESKKWADEFEKNLAQKKAERESIRVDEHELAQKLEIRWNPLYDYIMSILDNTILELQKKNLVTNYEKSDDVQLVQFQNYDHQSTNIRTISFPNKRTLYVRVSPAVIKAGQLYKGLAILFQLTYSGGGNLLSISFDEDSFKLRTLDGSSRKTSNDPLLDQEFRTQLTNAIHNSIEYSYLEEAVTP